MNQMEKAYFIMVEKTNFFINELFRDCSVFAKKIGLCHNTSQFRMPLIDNVQWMILSFRKFSDPAGLTLLAALLTKFSTKSHKGDRSQFYSRHDQRLPNGN